MPRFILITNYIKGNDSDFYKTYSLFLHPFKDKEGNIKIIFFFKLMKLKQGVSVFKVIYYYKVGRNFTSFVEKKFLEVI